MLRPLKTDETHLTDEQGYLVEMSDADREKLAALKERIKKLLLVGKDNRNISDAEMRSAMDMALKLARKNGLELYEIEREMRQGDERGQLFIVRIMELGGHAKWRINLASTVARAIICRVLIHTVSQKSKPNIRTGRTVRFPRADYVSVIGMANDIELVDYLYEYIVRELKRTADAQFKEEKALAALSGRFLSGKAWRDDFFRGAVMALEKRLKAEFGRETPADATDDDDDDDLPYEERPVAPDMALVVLKEKDVEEAVEKLFPTTKSVDTWTKQRNQHIISSKTALRNALMSGHEAARNLELRKALSDREVVGALE